LTEFSQALLSCALFLGSGIAGLSLRGVLPERHRDRETTEFVKLVVGALVAFLAIVLGLLTASSKTHFDDVSEAYRHFGATIVELDHALRETGPRAAEIRQDMRAYLAGVIASTWPQEPAPSGSYLHGLPSGQVESVQLSALLSNAEMMLHEIQATPDPSGREAEALARFGDFVDARWRVIETSHPTLPTLFYQLMLFWTALVFLGFGLSAKRNAVVAITVVICAVSLASVIYVILELDDPLSGRIAVSSAPLRDALADLDRDTHAPESVR
jgi:hypothetical protein